MKNKRKKNSNFLATMKIKLIFHEKIGDFFPLFWTLLTLRLVLQLGKHLRVLWSKQEPAVVIWWHPHKIACKFELVLGLIETSNFHFSGNIFSVKFMLMKQNFSVNAIQFTNWLRKILGILWEDFTLCFHNTFIIHVCLLKLSLNANTIELKKNSNNH